MPKRSVSPKVKDMLVTPRLVVTTDLCDDTEGVINAAMHVSSSGGGPAPSSAAAATAAGGAAREVAGVTNRSEDKEGDCGTANRSGHSSAAAITAASGAAPGLAGVVVDSSDDEEDASDAANCVPGPSSAAAITAAGGAAPELLAGVADRRDDKEGTSGAANCSGGTGSGHSSAAADTAAGGAAPEVIVIPDSSDDEGDAGDAANRSGGAGLGPSSAAAATAACGPAKGRRLRVKANGGAAAAVALAVKLVGTKCTYPVGGGKYSVEVTADDLTRLDDGAFLNDTCIDVYIKYLEHHLPEDRKQRYHFFNSFFLKKLMEKEKPAADNGGEGKRRKLSEEEVAKAATLKRKAEYDRVKNWTKHMDLFSKEYIFVPVHGHLHWSLMLLCHIGNLVPKLPKGSHAPQQRLGVPMLLHLDSLRSTHAPDTTFDAVRSFLQHEWEQRWPEEPKVVFDKDTLPSIRMNTRLPRQVNRTDCGLFLLSYMDFFTAANPSFVTFISGGRNAEGVVAVDPHKDAADSGTFMQKNWFRRDNTGRLRDHMRSFICGLIADRLRAAAENAGRGAPAAKQQYQVAKAVADEYQERVAKKQMGVAYFAPVAYLQYMRDNPDLVTEAAESD